MTWPWVKRNGTILGQAPPILVDFSGDWDVHWGGNQAFDPWPLGCSCQVESNGQSTRAKQLHLTRPPLGAEAALHASLAGNPAPKCRKAATTCGHGSKSRTPSEHPNSHSNRLKWVVHLPQNGTIHCSSNKSRRVGYQPEGERVHRRFDPASERTTSRQYPVALLIDPSAPKKCHDCAGAQRARACKWAGSVEG